MNNPQLGHTVEFKPGRYRFKYGEVIDIVKPFHTPPLSMKIAGRPRSAGLDAESYVVRVLQIGYRNNFYLNLWVKREDIV